MSITDEELDLGGVLGLDFVNTVVRTRAGPVDLLETPEDFVEWMRRVDDRSGETDLLGLAPRDLPGLRLLTVEARELRRALVALFRRVVDPAAAFTIDRALRATTATYGLVGPDDDGARLRTRFQPTGPFAALAPIALSAVCVARDTDPARLRECEAEDCVRWFIDTSRGGRRRWCSMARCGNRAKAARYRKRHAEEG